MIELMRWMRRAPIFIACAVSLTLPGEALALSIVPPGKSGADQYFETIPTSSGNAAPPPGGGSSGKGGATNPSRGRALTQLGQGRTGTARLARLGKDGQAAAALAAATGPSPAPKASERSVLGNSVGPRRETAPLQGESGGSAVSQTLTGSDAGGLGPLLPLLLGTTLIAALGFAAARLRRRSRPPDLSD